MTHTPETNQMRWERARIYARRLKEFEPLGFDVDALMLGDCKNRSGISTYNPRKRNSSGPVIDNPNGFKVWVDTEYRRIWPDI